MKSKWKKLLSFALVLALMAGFVPLNASAAEGQWEDGAVYPVGQEYTFKQDLVFCVANPTGSQLDDLSSIASASVSISDSGDVRITGNKVMNTEEAVDETLTLPSDAIGWQIHWVDFTAWYFESVSGCTVTFNSNGGSEIESQTVASGGKATKPADPTKEDYTFGGWYSDEELSVPFDFSTAITANTTLFAEWTPETPAGSVTVTGVSLNKTSTTLTVGDTETLTATVSPDDATDKSVTWSSDNESVATVADGVVTAVAAGTANITVTTTDGSFTATCAVTAEATVLEIGSVEDWNSFAADVKAGNTYSGKTVTLTADVGPVSTMVDGTFSGTFDGGGHTLKVDISGANVATFGNVTDGIIQNLTLSGTVTGTGVHTAALVKSVGQNNGTCTIQNVDVQVTVNCSANYIGGFVGNANTSSTIIIENSSFSGSINKTDSEGSYIGGFIGWGQRSTVTINNCVFTGSYSNVKSFNNIGFNYNAPTSVTVSNFYSTVTDVFGTNTNSATRLYNYTPAAAVVINGNAKTYYDSLSDALTAWTDGSTLTLLSDVTTNSTITVSTGAHILDLNGYGIRMTGDGSVIFVGTGASLVLNDSGTTVHYYNTNTSGPATLSDTATAQSFTGGYITGGKGYFESSSGSRYCGGGVYVKGGSFTMNGGTIFGNGEYNAYHTGGGVQLTGDGSSKGTFVMNGGAIIGNAGEYGGGIEIIGVKNSAGTYGYGPAECTINGGEFKYNTCKTSGSAIRFASNTYTTILNINGGTISGNSGNGAVMVFLENLSAAHQSAFNLSGNPVISGNMYGDQPCNLRLYQSKVNIVGSLGNSANIGVTMQTLGVFTDSTDSSFNDESRFTSDNASYMVAQNAAGQLELVSACTVTYKVVNGTWSDDSTGEKTETVASGSKPANVPAGMKASEGYTGGAWDTDPADATITGATTFTYTFEAAPHTHDSVTFSAWTSNNSLPSTPGNYYLTQDISISGAYTWEIASGTYNLCLNGHHIVIQKNKSNGVIWVKSGTLNIYDEPGDNGYITRTDNDNNYAIYVQGNFTLNGGKIKDNSSSAGYGAILIHPGGNMTMNGGEITGNKSYRGVVFVDGNTDKPASFTMNGGRIVGNDPKIRGAVFVGMGTFTMNGGEISGNTLTGSLDTEAASGFGAGVFVSSNGTFVYNDGVIANNTATHKGTDAVSDNVFLINGRTITVASNADTDHPIGVTMQNPGVFTDSADTSLNDASKFVSDNASYVVGKNADGQLVLGLPVTVTFDANGHGTAPEAQTVASDSSVTLPAALEAEGWSFGGWSDGTSTYDAGAEVTISADITFTAQWAKLVAEVNETTYTSFSDALSAWTEGTTLTLLDDVTTASTITVSGTKSLDLNGYGIRATSTYYSIFNLTNASHLTVTDSAPDRSHYITVESYRGTEVSDTGTPSEVTDGTGVVMISGGYITGGLKEDVNFSYGGAFCVNSNASLTMTGGSIIGNHACNGGAVYLNGSGSTASFTNTLFAYNSSLDWGGAIWNENSDSLRLINCTIRGNKTNKSNDGGGGAISFNSGNLYIDGGLFEQNATGGHGGAIRANCNLFISGNPVIVDNFSGTKRENIYLLSNKMITVNAALGSDVRIGVTMETPGVFTSSTDTSLNDASKFTSDNASYAVGKNADGQLYLGTPITVTYASDHGTAPEAQTVASGGSVTLPAALEAEGWSFGGWSDGTSTYDAGAEVTISADITFTAQWTAASATAPTIDGITGAELTYGYESGSVSVTATAAEGHSITGYQWYSNSTDSSEGGAAIEGATDASFAIPTGLSVGTYYYYCVVTATRTDNSQTAAATSSTVALTVSPASVTLTANSGEGSYDGTEKTVTGFTSSVDGLSFTGVSASGSGTNAGTYDVTFSGVTVNETKDTTGNYVVTETKNGTLTVDPIDATVTIVGATGTADYDGKAHTVTGYTATADTDLYDVDSDFTFSGTAEASQTDAGTAYMGLAAEQFENTNSNFGTVTFEVTDGYQTVEPIDATVTIVGATGTADYDGKAHTVTGYTATADSDLYDVNRDIAFSGRAEASQTDAGTAYMGLAAEKFKNTNDNFEKVMFVVTDGYQTVNKRSVILTSASDNKEYDGTALTKDAVTVSGDGFAEGEGMTYTVTGSQTVVGTSENAFTYTPDENTSADNYIITTVNGTLEVTQKPITITAASESKTYDEKPLTKNSYTNTSLAVGDRIESVTVTGSRTAVGSSDNVPSTAKIVNAAGEDVTASYAITYLNGTLTVTEADAQVSSNVDIVADTSGIAVDGLDEEAKAIQAAEGAQSVSVNMVVEQLAVETSAAAASTIGIQLRPEQDLELFEIDIEKTVDSVTTTVTETYTVLKIVIPCKLMGKENVTVYRSHDGVTAALIESDSGEDGTVQFDRENGTITIYTKLFSTYAVAYTQLYNVSGPIQYGDYTGNVTVTLTKSDSVTPVAQEEISVTDGMGLYEFTHVTKGSYVLTMQWTEAEKENTLTDTVEIK